MNRLLNRMTTWPFLAGISHIGSLQIQRAAQTRPPLIMARAKSQRQLERRQLA